MKFPYVWFCETNKGALLISGKIFREYERKRDLSIPRWAQTEAWRSHIRISQICVRQCKRQTWRQRRCGGGRLQCSTHRAMTHLRYCASEQKMFRPNSCVDYIHTMRLAAVLCSIMLVRGQTDAVFPPTRYIFKWFSTFGGYFWCRTSYEIAGPINLNIRMGVAFWVFLTHFRLDQLVPASASDTTEAQGGFSLLVALAEWD